MKFLFPAVVISLIAPSALGQQMNYSELKENLLEAMGSATRRVWIVTDSFVDGDLASSLYLNRFTGKDIRVALLQKKAFAPTSRYKYLSRQKIQTRLIPKIPLNTTTLVVLDQALFSISAPLNPYSQKNRLISMQRRSDTDLLVIESLFGNPRPQLKNPRKVTVLKSPKKSKKAFVYGRGEYKAPEGVAKKLPSQTVSQKKKSEGRKP